MRRDHRPAWLKHLWGRIEHGWARHFIAPQLDAVGPDCEFMQPWHMRFHGPNIRFGNHVHAIGARDRFIQLCTWVHPDGEGHITLADHCLVCPGVRIDSATAVDIGEGSMLASSAYITDADWHDVYDRTRAIGSTRPVRLAANVWIGDRATVCKGVSIGANSIVGAGAVVTADVPDNVIVAGNPARVVKALDPERELRTRAALADNPEGSREWLDALDAYLLAGNSVAGWLRNRIWPRPGD